MLAFRSCSDGTLILGAKAMNKAPIYEQTNFTSKVFEPRNSCYRFRQWIRSEMVGLDGPSRRWKARHG